MRFRQALWVFLLATILFPFGTEAKSERLIIQGDHGKLVADLQTPDAMRERCPIVIICHGFTGNRNEPLLRKIADGLEAKGIASIRFDFNAHGESEGKFEEMTIPNEIEDARLIFEHISADARFGRIGLVGHSQGGVVASMLAGKLGKRNIKAVALYAPAAVIRDDAIRGSILNQPGDHGDPLDPPEYIEIWGHRIGRNYVTTAFWLPIYETAALYKGPACIVHGTADRIVPYTYGLRYHQMWKKSEYHQLDRFDHGFNPDVPRAAAISVDFFVRSLR
ncbi:MAG: alpha/beta fold hydrolase [Bacteroidaceae bacterium]|nr:alpha/beta fold hydrolase [Bacteroidaceae bacterium]